jgi:flagellar motility protein MotE (MotC chaperone)
MKKLNNPIILVALGLFLGVGTSLGFFWKAAAPLIAQARQSRVKVHTVEKPDAPWDFWTIEIESLASELKDAKAGLKKREDEIIAREARFTSDRLEISRQRQQLEALRTEISDTMVSIKADEMKNMKSLVATYSSLSPKAALTIFRQMDDTMVVKLFALMPNDVRAPLFEEMSKQGIADPTIARRAALITEKLRLYQAPSTASTP